MNYNYYCLASPKPDGSPLRVRAFSLYLSIVSVKEQGGSRSFGSDGKSQTKAELMKCTSSTSTEYKRSCYNPTVPRLSCVSEERDILGSLGRWYLEERSESPLWPEASSQLSSRSVFATLSDGFLLHRTFFWWRHTCNRSKPTRSHSTEQKRPSGPGLDFCFSVM